LKIKNAKNKILIIVGLIVIVIFTLINNLKLVNAWTYEEICDYAIQNRYHKPFPVYENIIIFHNGHEVNLNSLTVDQKFDLLVESSLGHRAKATMRERRDEYDRNPDDFIKQVIRLGNDFSTIHGPKHCVRTAILAEEIARLYKSLYVELESITDEDISCCFFAGVYHDSGRQSDGLDIYDPLSAHYCEIDLRAKEVPEASVKKAEDAILNKDQRVDTKGIVAIALHDADSMEMQRFRGFDSSYLNCNNLTLRSGIDPNFAQSQVNALCQRAQNFIRNTGDRDNFDDVITYQTAIAVWIDLPLMPNEC
jgi:hypothetical protein